MRRVREQAKLGSRGHRSCVVPVPPEDIGFRIGPIIGGNLDTRGVCGEGP